MSACNRTTTALSRWDASTTWPMPCCGPMSPPRNSRPMAHIGDSDNVFNTFRVNNTVIYKSPVYDGLRVSGMYSLGGQTQSQSNNAYALGLNYQRGGLSLGTMYEVVNTRTVPPTRTGRWWRTMASARPSSRAPAARAWTVSGSSARAARQSSARWACRCSTHVRFDYLDRTRLGLNNAEVSTAYNLSPRLLLGACLYLHLGRVQTVGNPSEMAPDQYRRGLFPEQADRPVCDGHLSARGRRRAVRADLYAVALIGQEPGLDGGGHAAQVLSAPVSGPGGHA